MTKILGIDDAGRGPVIGPMILGGVLIDEKDNKILKELGVKDSKLLTPKKRNEIKKELEKKFNYHLEITSPKEIDECSNLNYLEAVKSAMIINKITRGIEEPIKVIIDCPSTNIKSWTTDVQKLIENPKNISLTCEHKADLNHPVVSAASILAKEKREEEIVKLKKEFEIDFGSGYPSDPKTVEFIQKNFQEKKFSSIIRFSWDTVKKLTKGKEQKKLF